MRSDSLQHIKLESGFGSDVRALERGDYIAKLPFVKRVVSFPDVGWGYDVMEKPSSMVILTKDIIVPQFSSNVINCGMGGVAIINFDEGNIKAFSNDIISRLRMTFPVNADIRRDMFLRGPEALIHGRYVTEDIAAVFRGVKPFSHKSLHKYIPSLLLVLADKRFIPDVNLSGNHFIELHRIKGTNNHFIALHADSPLTQAVHWSYVKRRKIRYQPWLNKVALFGSKLLFHIVRKPENVSQKLKYYFVKHEFLPIPIESSEGERYLIMYQLCMNYGFAVRALIYNAICVSLRNLGAMPKFMFDHPHESISFESEGIIHRQGANVLRPNEVFFMPGCYNTESRLCNTGEGAADYLYSCDHGSGNHIRRRPFEKFPTHHVQRCIFSKDRQDIFDIDFFYNDGIDKVMDVLTKNKIAYVQHALVPLLNIKASSPHVLI